MPGAEEFASRPRSRRDFFKTLAAAGTGAAGGSFLLSGKASAQGAGGDTDILNFALTLEYLEAEFYGLALDAGILSSDAEAVIAQIADNIEVQHRVALIGLIEDLGGTPVERPEFVVPDYVLASEGAFLETALVQERTDVGAFLGAAPMIQDPDVLAAAGALSGVEGENVVAVTNLISGLPAAVEAFPAALTLAEVEAAIAPFVVGGMMETGGEEYRDPSSFGRV